MKVTHVLSIKHIDEDGYIVWQSMCLNDTTDFTRDCRLAEEARHETDDEYEDCEVGVHHPEMGHAHPANGCGLAHAFGWAGMGDSVFFENGGIENPSFPMKATVQWDEDSIIVTPVKEDT